MIRKSLLAFGAALILLQFSCAKKRDDAATLAADAQTSATFEYLTNERTIDQTFDAKTIAQLRKYKVLIVPGYMMDMVNALAKSLENHAPKLNERLGVYFKDQLDVLTENKIDAEVVATDTMGPIQINAQLLKTRIAASKKPVIIFGHSKGGLEALDMLLSSSAEAAKKVAGVILLQSPIKGTPVADMFYDSGYKSEIFKFYGAAAFGEKWRLSLKEMRVSARKSYLDSYAPQIKALSEQLPILLVATWKPDDPGYDTFMEGIRLWLNKQGLRNDGLVPVDSMELGSADKVVISGVDHFGTTLACEGQGDFDRKRGFKTMLKMILERINNHAKK